MAENAFAAAFTELLDANDAELGKPQFVLIDGKKHRAIISDVSSEYIRVIGGNADAGGFACQVPTSGFSQDPEKGLSAQRMGIGPEFEILGEVKKVNDAVYEIVAGDPEAER